MYQPRKHNEAEHERQKARLHLLKQEARIRRVDEVIQSKSETQLRLRDVLEALQYSCPVLEAQESVCTCRKSWKPWGSARSQISNLKLKLKESFLVVKTLKQLSCITKTIQSLETSASNAKIAFERAKVEYYSQWGEEDCCKPKIEALSIATRQLEQAKNEILVVKVQLEETKAKLRSSNQQLEEQRVDFGTIRAKLIYTYREIQEEVSRIAAVEESLSLTPENPSDVPPHLFTSATLDDRSANTELETNPTVMTELGVGLGKDIRVGKDTVFQKLKVIETKLKDNLILIEAQKDKIERMQPLYQIGLDTRHRKFELDIKRADGRDWTLVHQGNEAAHYGRALADAVMCMDHLQRYPGEFEDQYKDVPAKVVWKHKEFKIFHELLSWRMDMKQFGTACRQSVFAKEFEFLFSHIYPDFKVASDEAITQDPKLRAAYDRLYLEYKEACRQYRTARRDRRDS